MAHIITRILLMVVNIVVSSGVRLREALLRFMDGDGNAKYFANSLI